jgi:hypothetical protein
MSIRRLNARLERLAPSRPLIHQDRQQNRWRRDFLVARRSRNESLTPEEAAELSALDEYFRDEARDRARKRELWMRQERGEPLTEGEIRELEELKQRYPPFVSQQSIDAWAAVARSNPHDWRNRGPARAS